MYFPQDNVEQPLYVITPLFNPQRYKRRWKLWADFQKHVRDAGAILLTVECSFGERTSAADNWAYPNDSKEDPTYTSFGPAPVPPAAKMPPSRLKQDYIKLRCDYEQEIWTKESLLNVALQHLPPDWKYVAWIDSDVIFSRPDWVSETLHQLQHYHVVQMFSVALDLSPRYEPIAAHHSFVHSYQQGLVPPDSGNYYGDYYAGADDGKSKLNRWHSGYAWAARREALDIVGGFMDFPILGAADHHMAKALIGRGEESVHKDIHPNYRAAVMAWQDRAEQHIKRNVGCVDGTLLHFWHGSKVNRRYVDRWKILVQNNFDPQVDIYKDTRGIYRLSGNKPLLRDQIRAYFKQRNEDGIDMQEGDDKLGLLSDHDHLVPW